MKYVAGRNIAGQILEVMGVDLPYVYAFDLLIPPNPLPMVLTLNRHVIDETTRVGDTVYNVSHFGDARTSEHFDRIRKDSCSRYMSHFGDDHNCFTRHQVEDKSERIEFPHIDDVKVREILGIPKEWSTRTINLRFRLNEAVTFQVDSFADRDNLLTLKDLLKRPIN